MGNVPALQNFLTIIFASDQSNFISICESVFNTSQVENLSESFMLKLQCNVDLTVYELHVMKKRIK